MKVTLTHDGKSVELDLTAEQMTALGLKEEKKRTGYERVGLERDYWFVDDIGNVRSDCEEIGISCMYTRDRYDSANYYFDEDLACANARADRLMRELRRFAAENGGIPSTKDWGKSDHDRDKYFIRYDYTEMMSVNRLFCDTSSPVFRSAGVVYFNSAEACKKAIEQFFDELIWYFTEYEAMLR